MVAIVLSMLVLQDSSSVTLPATEVATITRDGVRTSNAYLDVDHDPKGQFNSLVAIDFTPTKSMRPFKSLTLELSESVFRYTAPNHILVALAENADSSILPGSKELKWEPTGPAGLVGLIPLADYDFRTTAQQKRRDHHLDSIPLRLTAEARKLLVMDFNDGKTIRFILETNPSFRPPKGEANASFYGSGASSPRLRICF